jgi:hypothetical protein
MVHNPARLLKLDFWIRLFSWYYLAVLGLKLFGLLMAGFYVYFNSNLIEMFHAGGVNINWYRVDLLSSNITALSGALVFYLLLLSVSKSIHYLLALRNWLQEP